MARNKPSENRAENPAARLHLARAGRGPSAQALAYGIGGTPTTGQADRSEFDALTDPQRAGIGYEATLEGNVPSGSASASMTPRPARKACPPGANSGSDYRSPETYRVRSVPKSD